jgi:hypothetical protein
VATGRGAAAPRAPTAGSRELGVNGPALPADQFGDP